MNNNVLILLYIYEILHYFLVSMSVVMSMGTSENDTMMFLDTEYQNSRKTRHAWISAPIDRSKAHA